MQVTSADKGLRHRFHAQAPLTVVSRHCVWLTHKATSRSLSLTALRTGWPLGASSAYPYILPLLSGTSAVMEPGVHFQSPWLPVLWATGKEVDNTLVSLELQVSPFPLPVRTYLFSTETSACRNTSSASQERGSDSPISVRFAVSPGTRLCRKCH